MSIKNIFFETPILLLVFNRPDKTKLLLEAIEKINPRNLYIAADGPRLNNFNDAEKCNEVKKVIAQAKLQNPANTLYQKANLGCGKAVSTGIDWFFSHVESGIILEDDCLPEESFFHFCSKMLHRYKDDTRIFHIAGTEEDSCNNIVDDSYYFSKIPRVWGWATWKRAWKHFDFEMKTFEHFKKTNQITNVFENEIMQLFWLATSTPSPEKKVWAFRWCYAVFSQNGLCINPTKNLIKNIGSGEDATHTKEASSKLFFTKTYSIDVESLKHPNFILPNLEKERWAMENFFGANLKPGITYKIKKQIKSRAPFIHNVYKKIKSIRRNETK